MTQIVRVAYQGPYREGIPEGRMGTLISADATTALVSWDLYPGVECQITHSGVLTSEIRYIEIIEAPTPQIFEFQYTIPFERGTLYILETSREEATKAAQAAIGEHGEVRFCQEHGSHIMVPLETISSNY